MKPTIVTVTGCIDLPYPSEIVRTFIKELTRIAAYEPKLRDAHVQPADETDGALGVYRTQGTFWRVPWRGEFDYVCYDEGFHSRMIRGLLSGNMQGGFIVLPIDATQCRLYHYEEYRFHRCAYPLRPGIDRYLRKAMAQELGDIGSQVAASVSEDSGSVAAPKIEPGITVSIRHEAVLPQHAENVTIAMWLAGDSESSTTHIGPAPAAQALEAITQRLFLTEAQGAHVYADVQGTTDKSCCVLM